jgi:hypothetical protein
VATAGEELRARMDAALASAGQDAGAALEWSETELHHLDAAARCADRIELLQARLGDAMAEEDPSAAVKLSAELRMLDKAVGDHLGKVQVGAGEAKSERHQRAVNARWDARRAEHEAARKARGY